MKLDIIGDEYKLPGTTGKSFGITINPEFSNYCLDIIPVSGTSEPLEIPNEENDIDKLDRYISELKQLKEWLLREPKKEHFEANIDKMQYNFDWLHWYNECPELSDGLYELVKNLIE